MVEDSQPQKAMQTQVTQQVMIVRVYCEKKTNLN